MPQICGGGCVLFGGLSCEVLGIGSVVGDITCAYCSQGRIERESGEIREKQVSSFLRVEKEHLGANRNGNGSCPLGEKAVRAGL